MTSGKFVSDKLFLTCSDCRETKEYQFKEKGFSFRVVSNDFERRHKDCHKNKSALRKHIERLNK
jgi:hypothetical protein